MLPGALGPVPFTSFVITGLVPVISFGWGTVLVGS